MSFQEEEGGIFFEDHSSNEWQGGESNLLFSFPNILTPSHQAFLTQEALHEIARVTAENLIRIGRGDPLNHSRLA